MEKSRSRSVYEPDTNVFSDKLRKGTVRGHGQTEVVFSDWIRIRTRTGRGQVTNTDIAEDNGADTSGQIATDSRTN
jgi:hypothetical protein